jgi:RND family efflux transporter MFP subunit
LYEAKEESISHVIDLMGVVHPDESLTYASKIPGKVLTVYVDVGDPVGQGTLLFAVDSEDVEKNYESAKLQSVQVGDQLKMAYRVYDFEQNNYNDMKVLFDGGSLSRVAYDGAKLKLDQAKTQVENLEKQLELSRVALERAKRNLEETKVYSSIEGTVSKVLIEEEDYLTTGKPALVIMSSKQGVTFGVTQEELGSFKCGDLITVDEEGYKFDCTIIQIAKLPDRQTGLFTIKTEINDLIHKMPIGKIVTGTKEEKVNTGISVPISAILAGETSYVYVVREDIVLRKEVEIIDYLDGRVQISGIEDKDLVVAEGINGLDDNDKIRDLSKEISNEENN